MSSQSFSIHQAMEDMQLQQPFQALPELPKPAMPDRIVLPLPKRTGISKQRRIFYGFEVTNEWLVEYCEKNAHRILNYNPTRTLTTKMFLAMKLLAATSRVQNLTIEGAICRVSEPSHELGGDEGCVPIVCVCSSMNSSYQSRPTDPQLEKLRSIMDKEPEWFVDFHPPSYYG